MQMERSIMREASDKQSRAAARLIAFYLPQFHPIPENDEWWGKGFTEWTNTAKAKPLFRGHYQPHLPADLGFYDLRLPEARIAQAEMARTYGVEAFCYYHYWFAGRQLLERPFNEVLASGEPNFPFCICWANESWRGVWHGSPRSVLVEQTYPGDDDHRAHFRALLPAFTDDRYFTVDGKPLLMIYRQVRDMRRMTDLWRDMAAKAGLPGLHLVAMVGSRKHWNPQDHGFDASVILPFPPLWLWHSWRHPIRKFARYISARRGRPVVYDYRRIMLDLVHTEPPYDQHYHCLVPNWDNTPRAGEKGLVLNGSTPELFRQQVRKAMQLTRSVRAEGRIVFLKSWNEWAEGNHLEPDLKFGRRYLEALRDEVCVAELAETAPAPSDDDRFSMAR
jgi:hypothetical protein